MDSTLDLGATKVSGGEWGKSVPSERPSGGGSVPVLGLEEDLDSRPGPE